MQQRIKTIDTSALDDVLRHALEAAFEEKDFDIVLEDADVTLHAEDTQDRLALTDKTGRIKYLNFPFSFHDLLALLAKFNHEVRDMMIGEYLFSYQRKEISDSQNLVKLREKEADILLFLYGQKDQILPKEEMLSRIWGYHEDIVTTTLETHIYRLRKKLKETGLQIDIAAKDGGYALFTGSD